MIFVSPPIIKNGLELYLDASNKRSYPGSGIAWNDLSGNNNHGTLINEPIYNKNPIDGCIVLDGVDQYINVTETKNMTPQILTVEVIFQVNSDTNNAYGGHPGTSQYIVFRQNTRTGFFEGYTIFYSEIGKNFAIYTTNSSGLQKGISSKTPANLNSIYILTAVFDNTIQSIYINGRFDNSGEKSSGIDYNSTHTLKIGRSVPVGNTWDSAMNGQIYSIKLYSRALSSSEIIQNYNAQKTKFGFS